MKGNLKNESKIALIKVGRRIIVEKGYNNTGIQEVLQVAGIAKGSFYHFFSSKEDFGIQIINRDADEHDKVLEQYLSNETLSPLNRLKHYFEDKCQEFESLQCREGCLLGNLGQEMADQNEAFRTRLQEVFAQWHDRLADCLRQAQTAGEISPQWDARQLAEYCHNSWEGALLQMKITKSPAPLKAFITLTFGTVLKG